MCGGRGIQPTKDMKMRIRSLIFTIALCLVSTLTYAKEPLVTFVCTGNTGRSPMAESLAEKIIHQKHLKIDVQSRGLHVNPKETKPEEGTVTLLKERGINISTHKATQLTKADIEQSTLLLTMTNKHKETILAQYPEAKGRVFTLSEYAIGKHEDLSDPYGKPLEAYKKVESQLDSLLPEALIKIEKTQR